MNRTTLTAYVLATRAALRARRIIARIEARDARCTVSQWQASQDAANADREPATLRSPLFAVEA